LRLQTGLQFGELDEDISRVWENIKGISKPLLRESRSAQIEAA